MHLVQFLTIFITGNFSLYILNVHHEQVNFSGKFLALNCHCLHRSLAHDCSYILTLINTNIIKPYIASIYDVL